jgi:hypothetical protein
LVSHETPKLGVFDFRLVWANRPACAYILTRMCHMWEMFAVRSWLVAFLTFSITLQEGPAGLMAPTTVMAVAGIGGMLASIAGGELAVWLGRRRVVTTIMGVSCLLALTIGFSTRLPYNAVVILCLVYTLFFQGDSAAIHAGVITAAKPERQGATMALQSGRVRRRFLGVGGCRYDFRPYRRRIHVTVLGDDLCLNVDCRRAGSPSAAPNPPAPYPLMTEPIKFLLTYKAISPILLPEKGSFLSDNRRSRWAIRTRNASGCSITI